MTDPLNIFGSPTILCNSFITSKVIHIRLRLTLKYGLYRSSAMTPTPTRLVLRQDEDPLSAMLTMTTSTISAVSEASSDSAAPSSLHAGKAVLICGIVIVLFVFWIIFFAWRICAIHSHNLRFGLKALLLPGGLRIDWLGINIQPAESNPSKPIVTFEGAPRSQLLDCQGPDIDADGRRRSRGIDGEDPEVGPLEALPAYFRTDRSLPRYNDSAVDGELQEVMALSQHGFPPGYNFPTPPEPAHVREPLTKPSVVDE